MILSTPAVQPRHGWRRQESSTPDEDTSLFSWLKPHRECVGWYEDFLTVYRKTQNRRRTCFRHSILLENFDGKAVCQINRPCASCHTAGYHEQWWSDKLLIVCQCVSPAFCETSCWTSKLLHYYDQEFYLIISIVLESVNVMNYNVIVHKSNLKIGEFVQLCRNICASCIFSHWVVSVYIYFICILLNLLFIYL